MILTRKDIEEIGVSVFRRVTDPKAMYVTLFQRWWLITICALVGVAFGLFVIKTTTPKFESHGQILVIPKTTKFIDESTKQPDAKAYDSFFPSHLSLIGSQKIIRQAVNEKNLWELPVLNSLVSKDRTPIDYIKNHLKVTRGGSGDAKGAFVIKVGFEHTDAQEAAIVVESVLEAYKSYVEKSMLDDQDKAVELVEKLRDDLDQDVKSKSKTYREFIANSPSVWDRETLDNYHQQQVSALKEELAQLELNRVRLESRVEIMARNVDPKTGRTLSDLDKLSLIDDLHVPRLNVLVAVKNNELSEEYRKDYPARQELANARYGDLLKLKVEYNRLSGNLGNDHPDMKDLVSQIAELEMLLKSSNSTIDGQENKTVELTPTEIVRAYKVLLEQDLEDVRNRIAFVNKSIEKENSLAIELLDVSIQADHYREEYERSRDLYSVMLEQAKKQNLVSDFGGYVAEIIATPQKGALTWPKKPVILALCTLLGGFTGVFLAVGFDLLALTPVRPLRRFIPKPIRRFVLRMVKRFVPRFIRGGIVRWLLENVDVKRSPARGA